MADIDEKYIKYPNDVLSGKIVACNYVKLACQRYLNLLKNNGITFDGSKADKVIKFIRNLKHFTGKHNGKPFILSPWQEFIIYSIYGFYNADGTRTVRNAYVEIGRKNGKTALVAALTLYHLIADGESNAQVILSATSAKQAKICYEMASNFLKPIDLKGKYFKRYRDTIKFNATNSSLFIVAADATRLDGYNASMFVCDELHEHKDGTVFNVLQSSVGMRSQPLGICITTAGFNTSSFCYSMRQSMLELLNGKKEDNSQFAIIFTLDEGDDYSDEKNWIKSNPNLNVTITTDYLRQQLTQAQNNSTLMTNFLTKLMNQWLRSAEQWIAMNYIFKAQKKWEYKDIEEPFAYLGVDLGATSDLTAVSVLIPKDGIYYFRNYYFLPSECLNSHPNRELYRDWQRNGHLIVTNGNVTDYDSVVDELMRLNQQVNIVQVSFDSWNATQMVITASEQGLNLQPYSQSIASLNKPTKELARLIMSDKVVMYDNPIDRYCFENVTIKRDYNDNERPTKDTYNNKIDGVMAMIMALGGYLSTNHWDNTVTALEF